jgi:hypothetical protein
LLRLSSGMSIQKSLYLLLEGFCVYVPDDSPRKGQNI